MQSSDINHIFDKSKLTQEAFAKKIKVSTRTLQNYLDGTTSPNGKKIKLIKAVGSEIGAQDISHEVQLSEKEITALNKKFDNISTTEQPSFNCCPSVIFYLSLLTITLFQRTL